MARRITRHRVPEDVQKLRAEAESTLKAAQRDANEIGRSVGAMREENDKVEQRLKELDAIYGKKLKELEAVDAEIEGKRLELRKLEGDVTTALAKCAEVELQTQKAVVDQEKLTRRAREEHVSVLDAQDKVLAQLQREVDSLRATKSTLDAEITAANVSIAQLHTEEKRLTGILQKIPEAERELEELSESKTGIELQVLEFEKRLVETKGKYNNEKARYDEVVALRNGEEKELEKRRIQLIEKEEEVERKVRNLRQIQAGVDQATKRLERREQEVELKLHLANKPSEVTEQ